MSNSTATKSYDVTRYNDGQVVGRVELTDKQYRHWQAMAQQPEGIIRLGALPHDYYDIDEEYQDLSEDTVVYLD